MTRLLFYHLALWLCHQHHLVSPTTRYLPSAPSSVQSLPVSPPLSSALQLTPKALPPLRASSPPEKATSSTRTPWALASKVLRRDLARLARMLPGVYTNTEQYHWEAAGGESVPRRQRHVLLRSSYRPVTLSFLPRSSWSVLVQDYSGDSLFPFRQRVCTFSPDPAQRAVRMKVWDFATQQAQKRATRNLSHFQALRRKDLLSQGSCDMFWRRADRTTFVGLTGKQCLGYVKGEQVRFLQHVPRRVSDWGLGGEECGR